MDVGDRGVLDLAGLQRLLDVLVAEGREVLGPTVRDEAIAYAPITTVEDLPRGVGDEQEPGRYRLRDRGDEACFGFASTPVAWKATLFPSRHLLWRSERGADGSVQVHAQPAGSRPRAFLGVRGCDLAAIAVHDRVLRERVGGRPTADPQYAAARTDLFLVAVACGSPASTCFCTSTGTGPAPGGGADLLLTEILEGAHRFLVEAASAEGARVAALLDLAPADPGDAEAAARVVEDAADTITRRLDTDAAAQRLPERPEHPGWDRVAQQCLACGNCTLACPTCFCTTARDVSDLTGDVTERWRVWDSCFTAEFSYLHGGSVRSSTKARYRQWATHKLATWRGQFGTAGCVGCGRCLTWCPAAIDLTAAVAAVDGSEA